jgi:hypothetical protein
MLPAVLLQRLLITPHQFLTPGMAFVPGRLRAAQTGGEQRGALGPLTLGGKGSGVGDIELQHVESGLRDEDSITQAKTPRGVWCGAATGT